MQSVWDNNSDVLLRAFIYKYVINKINLFHQCDWGA